MGGLRIPQVSLQLQVLLMGFDRNRWALGHRPGFIKMLPTSLFPDYRAVQMTLPSHCGCKEWSPFRGLYFNISSISLYINGERPGIFNLVFHGRKLPSLKCPGFILMNKWKRSSTMVEEGENNGRFNFVVWSKGLCLKKELLL
ncbi:hypothetical protein CDAR_451681 [Caerostris darwini]|uniref:Galectin n=1 Tax=Caerostris darwini TaxID=1538125 RepID=A0AAV4VZ40_9ARAC|nr:hypothetical protein CDAR_451681 [Caerostris darwini]